MGGGWWWVVSFAKRQAVARSLARSFALSDRSVLLFCCFFCFFVAFLSFFYEARMTFYIIGSGGHLKASELRALLVPFHSIFTGLRIYDTFGTIFHETKCTVSQYSFMQ